MGLERLLMALEAENIEFIKEEQLDSFIVAVGDKAEKEAIKIVHELRQHGIQIDKDYQGRKVKAQFKAANRYNARFVLILGDDELEKDIINIREMETGHQEEVKLDKLIDYMQNKLLGGHGK